MKTHPSSVVKIQKDYQTFVHNKPRLCTGIYALGTSDTSGTTHVSDTDDRPSLTFDDNGYICHLADDSDVRAADDMSSNGELSVHIDPFDPLIVFDDANLPYQPGMDKYRIANIIDDADAARDTAGPSSYEAALAMLQNEGMDTQEDDAEQGNALSRSALPLVGPARHL
jgi:hypothetical protein